jgi:hypothetical protein
MVHRFRRNLCRALARDGGHGSDVARQWSAGAANPINGQKAVSFDVAAWADLWFYSNPIYIEVAGSTPVAGIM